MTEATETLSQFWHWFIIIPTVLGLAGCLWLLVGNKGTRKNQGETTDTMGHVWDEDLEEYNNPLPSWWLNLFYITLIFAVVYLVLYPGLGNFKGLLGWTEISQYEQEVQNANAEFGPLFKQYATTDIKALIKNPDAIKTGRRLFATYCTTCHGSDARGAIGYPNLRDNDWLWGGNPEAIKTSIAQGRNGVMPPWGQVLNTEEQFAVAEYIRKLRGKDADPSVVILGEQKFNTLCASCHGADGAGNHQLGAPNLTDDIALYGNSQRALIKSIAEGRMGQMPAHGNFLGENKVHLLTAYVYGLSNSE